MSLLHRKLRRDLLRLWTQVLTIGLVLGSAVGALVTTQACVHSLQQARETFYRDARMADVFASVRRAPRAVLPLFSGLSGVAQVQATLERPARLMLPGQVDAVMGHLVGVAQGQPLALNRVFLRAAPGARGTTLGLWPGAALADGTLPVWISEGFAQARGLRPGDRLQALMNGRLWGLQITALALAPDAIFAGGMGMPDPRGYAVLWVDEAALAAAWDLQGQWTRLVLRLAPGAQEEAVLAALASMLPRWGGREALPRRLQSSHQMLDNEIQEQQLLGTILPMVFVGVSVFLLHTVMTRLVAMQREPLACLKALGFTGTALAVHAFGFASAMALVGLVAGGALGWAAGSMLMSLYGEFFRFPDLPLVVPVGVWATAVAVAFGAAALGVAQAMREILRLSPAVALQPPAPSGHRLGLEQHLGGLPLALRMILRQILRRPWRATFATLGMASAMALVVMGNFFRDAIDEIVSRQFEVVWRGDVQLITGDPVNRGALQELRRAPGVMAVEGSRSVAATLVHGHRTQRVQLRGLEGGGEMGCCEGVGSARAIVEHPAQMRLVDAQGRAIEPVDDGLVLTDRLARKLGLRVGDVVLLRVPEAPTPQVWLRVAALMGETMGLNATTTRATVNRLMREPEAYNGFSLQVATDRLDELLQATKAMPRVAAAFSKAHLLRNMQAITARNIRIMSFIMTGFALIVAVGVVFNQARIALAERSWELASLRVLGFSRAEVAQLVIGEQALLLALAMPLGLLLGWGLVEGLVRGLRSDQFEFPVVIWPRTQLLAVAAVVGAGLCSAIVIVRRIRRLDLVAALKTRE